MTLVNTWSKEARDFMYNTDKLQPKMSAESFAACTRMLRTFGYDPYNSETGREWMQKGTDG